MTNLTSALRIGTSGLNVAQKSLSTISHNVVNANTPGYSRQVVQAGAESVNGFGNGVALSTIQRVADRFLNLRSFSATSDLSFAETRKTYLNSLESVMTGASAQGGLESVAGRFFESMSQLSNDPANSALKRNVVQQAELFTQTIRDISADLVTTAADADRAINAELTNANQLLRDIRDLNNQISAVNLGRADGANANDLRDARDQKINELSKLFKLQVNENGSNGSVRIALENGRRLVDEAGYVQMKRTAGTPYQGIALQAVLVDGSLSTTELPVEPATLSSGKVKALIDTRDTLTTNLQSQLNAFANEARTALNSLSSLGTAYPPLRTATSGNTQALGGVGDDLLADPSFGALANSTFHISVTNSLGQPALTTVGATAITIPGTGPFSLTDLADLINNDPTVGNTALGGTNGVIATAAVDANGQPFLQIQAANPAQRVVLANAGTGDPLGLLGMNTMFTGTGASDFRLRSEFVGNPELLPIARMRPNDGGVSSLDNQNILALAALADTQLGFGAAGGLGAQNATLGGYAGQIVSNLSVTINDAEDRITFAENINTQLEQLKSEISGVNVNEELSQMLVYQNSFQASARIVSVVDRLLEELVNLVR